VKPVSYEVRGTTAILTIERPERRNAVDNPTAVELLAGLRRFEGDDEALILILTGAGDEAFCAGSDL
jgi:enoyl-CoA hydratase